MSSKPKSSSKERAKSKTESRNASRGKAPKQRQLSTSHDKLSDAKGSTTSSSIHEGGEILFVDSTTVDFSGQGAAVIPATLFTSMLFIYSISEYFYCFSLSHISYNFIFILF